LEKAVARLGKIFDAEGKFNLRNEMKGALGLTDATFDQALDLTKPWQVAVWYEMPNPPLISLKIPAKDLDQFKASLIAEGMLSAQAKQWTALDGGMISISMLPAEAMAESQKAELQAWQSAALARPSPTVEFSTRLNEILRAQGLAGLKIAEAAMTANMPTNSAPGMPFDAKLMSRVFAVYFDVIETVLQGLKEYRVGLDITEEALVAEDHISAKDGTVLAQWLAKPRHALSASMRRLADPGALMAFAGGLGKDTNQLALLNQFMALGFQMQNVAADDPVIARIQEFFEALLPMTFAASVTAEKGLSFGGAYAFPEQGAAKAYGEIKRFMKNDMAALVGPDKM
jgi:hypothetical protein